jgi:hypothetical protein
MTPETFDLQGVYAEGAIPGGDPGFRGHGFPMLGVDAAGGRTLRDEGMARGHRPDEGGPHELVRVPLDPFPPHLDEDPAVSEPVDITGPEEMPPGVGFNAG